MIKIRLQRKGRIRRPIYHIVVADSRSPRDGRIIEQVGRFDGVTEKKETILNEDRIMYWLDTALSQPTLFVKFYVPRESYTSVTLKCGAKATKKSKLQWKSGKHTAILKKVTK